MAARDDLTLARMLLDRDDLDLDPEPLFLAANRLERTAIVLNACRQILASGATEAPLRADGALVEKLEAAAQRHDRKAMAALLSEALECRKDRARALVVDHLGEALALALNAIGVPLESAEHIFLCAEPGIAHDVEVVRALLGVMRSTPQRAAARIVGAMTGAARSERENSRRAAREDPVALTRRRAAPQQSLARPSRKFDQSA